MDSSKSRMRRRRWADVVVLFAGLLTLVSALWVAPVREAERAGASAWGAGNWWMVHAVAGCLALGALPVSLRSTAAARGMVALAGGGLLGFLIGSGGLGTLSLLTAGLPGALLLGAAAFVGPMPTPEQEGKSR